MKKVLFLFFAAFVLTACNDTDNVIKCGAYEVVAAIQGDVLNAVINGDEVALKQTISASGVRYEGILNDTIVVLWNKGSDWTLILNDETPIECE